MTGTGSPVAARTVGVAACVISGEPGCVLVSDALGSCVAVAVYDPMLKLGGLLHLMLPDSAMDSAKAHKNPFMFADTGVAVMFRKLKARGAKPHRVVARLAGGAQLVGEYNALEIGSRNHLAARKALLMQGVTIAAEAVGGSCSRTVHLHLGTGRFLVRESGGAEIDL